ncbi:MAG: hypothetical protein ABSA02_22295 [Trebonia sp.]
MAAPDARLDEHAAAVLRMLRGHLVPLVCRCTDLEARQWVGAALAA